MKRSVGLIVICLFLMLGIPVVAQDATPAAPPESFEIAPGVTAGSVVFVDEQENPSLYRLSFEPGVSYPVEPGPNLELVFMEAGSLTMQLDAPVTLGQLGDTSSAGESIAADTDFTLTAGQYFVLQPGVSGEVRNDGQETATVSIAGIGVQGMATPAATPAG
jgi:quercetin dioxygenase-like cupin family protein